MNDKELSDAWKKLVEDADAAGTNPSLTWKTTPAIPDSKAEQSEDADATLVAGAKGSHTASSLHIARDKKDLTIHAGDKEEKLSLPVLPEKSLEQLEEIGRGGMGAVYRARQNQLRRIVAVKTSHLKTEQDMAFLSEAFITAHLDHPNIAPVHDLAIADDQLKLVMKLVTGTSWRERLTADTCMGSLLENDLFDEHLAILQQVCQAVAFAHSRGILHCDLKPDNVMLGEFGEVLLMDWGVAIDFRDPSSITVEDARALHRSAVSCPRGTPVYMPAELTLGEGSLLGPWTDTYLCGAILYELINGKPPHIGHSLAEVLQKSLKSQREELPKDTPEELRKIVDKALHPDREKRYQSAIDLRDALSDFRRHRESHRIAEAGRKILKSCDKNIALQHSLDNQLRSGLYADFAESIAAFKQAQQLWSENSAAQKGELEARRSLAQFALKNGDLALAEAHISRFPEKDENRSELQGQLNAARALALKEKRNKTWLQRGLVASLSAIVIGAISFGVFATQKSRELEAETSRAKEAEQIANTAKDKARDAAREARDAEKAALAAKELAQKQSRKTYEAYRSLVVEVNDNLQGIMGRGVNEARLKLSKISLEGLKAGREDGSLQNRGETKVVAAEAWLNIAQVQINLKKNKAALQSIENSFQLLEGENNKEANRIRALCYMSLSELAFDNKDLEEAKKLSQKGIEITKTFKHRNTEYQYFIQVTAPLHLILGKTYFELGLKDKALDLYRDLLTEFQPFIRANKLGKESQSFLAHGLMKSGALYRLKNARKRSETDLKRAKELYESLLFERYLYRDHYRGLIETLCQLSAIEEDKGQKEESLRYANQALEIGENLQLIDGHQFESQNSFLIALTTNASALRNAGQAKNAIMANERGYKLASFFKEKGNNTNKLRGLWASFALQKGRALIDLKKYSEALPHQTKAIQILSELLVEDPENTRNRENLVLAYNDRAHNYQMLQKGPEAGKDFEKANLTLETFSKDALVTPRKLSIAVMVGSNGSRYFNKVGEHKSALKICKKSIDYAKKLVEINKENARFRRMLSVVLYDAGSTCLPLKKYKEGVEYFEQAAKNHEHLLKAQPELKREQEIFLKRAAHMRAQMKK